MDRPVGEDELPGHRPGAIENLEVKRLTIGERASAGLEEDVLAPALLGDELEGAGDAGGLGFLLTHRIDHLLQEGIVLHGVVRIEHPDEAPSRLGERALPVPDHADIGLVLEEADARIIEALDDGLAVVGRAVVHHHDLEISESLAQEDREEILEEVAVVVVGYADAELWRGWGA